MSISVDYYVIAITIIIIIIVIIIIIIIIAKQESQLESIQKRACKIILGKGYTTYETALSTCKLLALSERREQLCLAFAKSIEKNPHVSHWLQIKESNHEYSLRSNPKYQQYRCKTKRFQTSPIPYFIKLLNKESSTT